MRKIWTTIINTILKNKLVCTGGIIIVVILFAPLIIKCKGIKNFVIFLLSDLGGSKGAYLGIIGSIIGSFVAVTGALWTQRRIDKNKEKSEKVKCAKSIIFEITNGINFVKTMYISRFIGFRRAPWKIKLNQNWDEKILNLNDNITEDTLGEIINLYDQLYILSNYIEKQIYCSDDIEETTSNFLEPGINTTYTRNTTYEMYYEESDKIIKKLAKEILSDSIQKDLKDDKEALEEKEKLYYQKTEELDKYCMTNHINKFSQNDITDDPKKIEEYKNIEQEVKSICEEVENTKEDIIKKWKNICLSSYIDDNINNKYKTLISDLKNL